MKRITVFLWLLLLTLFTLTGCNLATIEENEEYTLLATDIDTITLDLEKGDIEIIGQDERTEIEVIASLVAIGENEDAANTFKENNLMVSLEQRGNEAILITDIDHAQQTATEGYIHLQVYTPSTMNVSLKQTAGLLHLENFTSDITLNHGVGDIILRNVEGNIHITDGAGSIELQQIRGNIQTYNNSGLFQLENLNGNIDLVAGSGTIDISNVNGSVKIVSGTGSITIDQIEEDVTIIENRSGEVTITNVKGKITP